MVSEPKTALPWVMPQEIERPNFALTLDGGAVPFSTNLHEDAKFIVSCANAHKELIELLSDACKSVEHQANWDKKPYSLWYYAAKKKLAELQGEA